MAYVEYEQSTPRSFALTQQTYRAFLEANQLPPAIRAQLDDLSSGFRSTSDVGATILDLFLRGEFPPAILEEIRTAYRDLVANGARSVRVEVRDGGSAGAALDRSSDYVQTSVRVSSEEALLDACRRCYASSLASRAMRQPSRRRFAEYDVALSVAAR